MAEFREIANRVWVARYDWCETNVSVIGSAQGLVVVDTHASTAAGRRVREDLAHLGEVCAVVNTHWHFDHTFGNAAFPGVPIHAHEEAVRELQEQGPCFASRYEGPYADEVADTEIVLPTQTFSSVSVIDLGDRVIELVHPGRAHTAGDLVVNVPDAGVLLAGDLVEESAPPSLGEDSWPLNWPLALDVVLQMLTSSSVVVPGHGSPVDRDFVEEQRATLGTVAETIRDLAGRGVAMKDALDAAQWPWPRDLLVDAVRRGYEHLPRSQKRLPLI